MNKNYYAVIMAGGIGSRFWPISTNKLPKQFHDILGTGNSLIQQTYNRFENLIPSENILIATNKKYKKLVKKHLSNIASNQILLEPAMLNTAPCILYSAFKIYCKNPDGIMIVAPSDHYIENEQEFISNVETSFDFCSQNDFLLTLGIQPTNPNTGYGYIKFDKSNNPIKKVLNFTEKPNLKTAEQFIKSGDYLWNAGIFIWSVKSILKAFETYLPEMFQLFSNGYDDYNTTSENNFIKENYVKSENISIDFGIMEKATNVCVLPTNFGWNDLGSWVSLQDKLDADEHQNTTIGGAVIFRDAKGNMVKTQSGKKVVIQGLNDFIVVEKKDVLLICPKAKEQEIKEITAEVKSTFGDKFV
ncbi:MULTISPECIES: mannose-1-phosphate guanylyltransferase [Flavobacteriaceae]|uniref:mannose-1-phosphate guanylyltransferase n=2 Tax=Flavobacteriaceae TaxID=49546 RepID=A0A4Y8ANY4_9FLAO|nr:MULTISPECIES: mannose-1-phosphate guanylyltransferase [Flavobacteriaceae]TEW72171.1 mannose-1-phosphate guanylyltransferase [Gramella jeungdoensis]GGK56962.1 mannose-1-phosphate guanylyltransferase [Lutibacter litoralis]